MLVLGTGLLGAGGPAEAQTAPTRRPHLVSQTSWVAEDQPFSLSFAVDGDLPADGTVELTLYGAVTSREPLIRGAADPSLLGDVRDTLSVPTALVPGGRDDAYRLRLATDGSTAGLPVADPGVYPLALAVAGPDGTPGPPMLTFIVRTAEDAAATPLLTAVVLPLHAPPSYGPDGRAVVSERARRLLEIRADLLDKYDDVALTVAPDAGDLGGRGRDGPRPDGHRPLGAGRPPRGRRALRPPRPGGLRGGPGTGRPAAGPVPGRRAGPCAGCCARTSTSGPGSARATRPHRPSTRWPRRGSTGPSSVRSR